jgi:hypothetical protein
MLAQRQQLITLAPSVPESRLVVAFDGEGNQRAYQQLGKERMPSIGQS